MMNPFEAAIRHTALQSIDEANDYATHHSMVFALDFEDQASEEDYDEYLRLIDA